MQDGDELSPMLREAMQQKARALGQRRYTYRELERDSGVHFTYAQKAIKHGLRPSREIITSWSKALAPYFPLDEALIAAGYLPDDPAKRRAIQRIWRLPADALNALAERAALGSAQFEVTLQEPEAERDQQDQHGAGTNKG